MDNFQGHVIALKTLKQRCEYLQERLKAVEEENCQLKLGMTQDLNRKNPSESSCLEEQIIILNKEKSQMTHQIQMIMKENFTLWSHLSKVLPESTISSLSFSFPPDQNDSTLKVGQCGSASDDCEAETLEDISLKLINGIITGKNELEKQYFQMINLQRENVTEDNFSVLPKQIDNRTAVKNLKEYVQKLKDFKQALHQQKKELSSAIKIIKNSKTISKNQISVSQKDVLLENNRVSDVNSQVDVKFLTLQNSKKCGNEHENFDSSEMICPMCGKSFTTEFIDFYVHVCNHFDSEDDEFVDARGSIAGVQ